MRSRAPHDPVIVAVAIVRVVQMAVDQVVDVIAMGQGGVATRRAVDVIGRVAAAAMPRRAGGWIRRVDGDRALVDVIAVHRVKMTVVEVVDVSAVLDREVTAVGAVDVIVLGMRAMGGHPDSFALDCCENDAGPARGHATSRTSTSLSPRI